MPLGTKVGLGPGHIVLHGDPAPQKGEAGNPAPSKGAQPPIFGPCLLWPNGRPSQLLLSTCLTNVYSQLVDIRLAKVDENEL